MKYSQTLLEEDSTNQLKFKLFTKTFKSFWKHIYEIKETYMMDFS